MNPSPFSLVYNFPNLYPFIAWCRDTALGAYVREHTWPFPFIETIHIVALAVLLGAIFVVNLRLLGMLGGWSVATLSRGLRPYITASLTVVLTTGVLLFLSDSTKYYNNPAFGPKMLFLAAALIFQYTLYRQAEGRWGKLAAIVSLALWFGVGAAGRAIGFTA